MIDVTVRGDGDNEAAKGSAATKAEYVGHIQSTGALEDV